MTDTPKERGPGSRILRERAMAQFRETRAKMDPQFLAAMKERFSAFVPGGFTSETGISDVPLMQKNAEMEAPHPASAAITPPSDSEPVDKEKIAQIVVGYMKLRGETSKH